MGARSRLRAEEGGDPEDDLGRGRRRDWKNIFQELEAGGEGAGGEDDGRGAAGDDRRSRSRRRRGGERGGVPPHHEEDQPVLSRNVRPSVIRSLRRAVEQVLASVGSTAPTRQASFLVWAPTPSLRIRISGAVMVS